MSPYVAPETGVLYNKLGIKDAAELKEAEYNATWVRGLELRSAPVLGNFDYDHLKAIHKTLFQDIYEWAGEQRVTNISKPVAGEPWWVSRFESPLTIEPLMHVLSDSIQQKNFLRGLGPEVFAKEMAEVYTLLNGLHPFREGNGRSTQTFLSQLATEAGHRLDFSLVDRPTWIEAAARTMSQENIRKPEMKRGADTTLIHQVFQRIVQPLREQTQAGLDQATVDQRVASAFINLPREEATKLYPQLAPGFDRLEAVANKMAQEGKSAPQVASFIQAVKEQIGRHLHAGQRLTLSPDDKVNQRGPSLER